MAKKASRPLAPMQKRFVEEYLVDLNATQAAIRAGYSPKNADSIAVQLLRKPQVKASVKVAMQARSRRASRGADWVLERLALEAEREGKGASHSARVTALGLLAKHHGLIRDRLEHSGPDGEPIRHQVVRLPTPSPSPVAWEADFSPLPIARGAAET